MRHWRTGEIIPDWIIEADEGGWEKAPRSNKLRRKGPGGQWEYKDAPSEKSDQSVDVLQSKTPKQVDAPAPQESAPQQNPAAMEDALKGVNPGEEEESTEEYKDLSRQELIEKVKNEGQSFVDYIDLQSSELGLNTEKVTDWLDKNGYKGKSNKEKIDKIDEMLKNKTWLKRFQSGKGYFVP